MGTNEFYYNKGKEITSKKAHELVDKSNLVVADRKLEAKELKAIKDLK